MIRPHLTTLATGLLAPCLAVPAAAVLLVAGPATAAPGSGPGNAAPRTVTAAACPSPGGAAVADAPAPSGAIKIYGHGWGHGMGMSQYGAQGAARLGCGYRTILRTYYRNTSLVERPMSASVVLALASASTRCTLLAETGPVQWRAGGASATQPAGSTWAAAARTVHGVRGVAALDAGGDVQVFAADGTALLARTGGNVVRVRATGSGAGLRTRWGTTRFVGTGAAVRVQHVIGSGSLPAVQKYLYGLGEVPASWPVEALKSQVVAARTYLASKYSPAAHAYVLSTGTADQVYRGYDQEATDARVGGKWHAAVVASRNQVLVDGAGRIISAMYSSSMGGHTENREYVYGRYGISYLKAVDDSRWDNASDNPYRRWSAGFSRAAFASRLGFTTVTDWKIARRGSQQRLAGLEVTGVRSGRTVTVHFTGAEARYRLGLRSPGFEFGASPA